MGLRSTRICCTFHILHYDQHSIVMIFCWTDQSHWWLAYFISDIWLFLNPHFKNVYFMSMTLSQYHATYYRWWYCSAIELLSFNLLKFSAYLIETHFFCFCYFSLSLLKWKFWFVVFWMLGPSAFGTLWFPPAFSCCSFAIFVSLLFLCSQFELTRTSLTNASQVWFKIDYSPEALASHHAPCFNFGFCHLQKSTHIL